MISKLSKALRNHQISVRELIDECRKNSEAFSGYNIFTAQFFNEALQSADSLQALIDAGEKSPLCGIPVAVKDNITYKNHLLSCSSKMLRGYISPYSATAVEKLQNAGGVIIGKTNMDEWGMGSHSQNSCFGGTKNPINSKFSPGGSSGGSAAAVKCGASIAALGSDTGGSVRLPAAYCGVYGLRPTYGAISRYGLVSFASSLDTVGIMANSPADCYLLFSAICGADGYDSTSTNGEQLDIDPKNAKICALTELLAHETDKEIYNITNAFLKRVSKDFGGIKQESLSDLQYVTSAYYLISSSEAASNLARFDGVKYGSTERKDLEFLELLSANRSELFGNSAKKRILLGNYALSKDGYVKYYHKATMFRESLKREVEAVLNIYEAIVLPTSLIPVPELTDTNSATKNFSNDKCNAIASLCGLPSITLPIGADSNGMPVSLSIIGRKFGEKYITKLAERMTQGVNPNV